MRRDAKTLSPFVMLITVLSVGLQDISAGAVSPAISAICQSYPSVSIGMIQMIVTLPTLAICIMAPVYGWLSNRIQPRRLIIYGLLLFCIGGSLPVFLNNLPLIMICRVALGVGTGITLPAALAIIPVFYEGKKRDKLIGFNQAVGSIGCIFMQQIGGYFADIDWHLSFLAYLMGLFSLVLVLLFLPDIPMEKVLKTADKDRKSIFSCVSTKIYGLAGVLFVAMIFACIPTTNLSLMIEGEGIGTATNTGTAMAVYSVGTMLGSAAFGYMKKAVGIYVLPLSYFFNGAGFFWSRHESLPDGCHHVFDACRIRHRRFAVRLSCPRGGTVKVGVCGVFRIHDGGSQWIGQFYPPNIRIALRFALRGGVRQRSNKGLRRLSGGDGHDTAHNLFGHGKKQAE